MSPQQWERVKSLFAAAVEEGIEPGEACRDDAIVCAETLRLLAARERVETAFLEPPDPETLLDRAARSLAQAATPSFVGQLLGERYLVDKEIGRGGHGVVYLARDQHLHSRRVVVKLLHAVFDSGTRARFQREIEALSRIHHPAVVGVLDVGQTPGGALFLVLEYVEGITLRELLQQGPLDLSVVAGVVGTISEALDAAHRNGVFHRDLKPENIMLTPSGNGVFTARLIDFGIARVADSEGVGTDTITIVGTFRYIAPEQLMGRAEALSDIYALGVVCYEMLTGRQPFEPDTPFHLYEMQRRGKPAAPSTLRKTLPRAVDRTLLRALSFRADDRPPSAIAFVTEFQSALHQERPYRLNLLVKWAAVAILSLGITAGGWQWLRGTASSFDHAVDFEGGSDPEEFGFQRYLDLTERAVSNPDHTGFDAIRLLTSDQGHYYRKLTSAQAYAAVRYGWKMSATLRSVQGDTGVSVDLSPADGRYDINVIGDAAGRQKAILVRQIAKGIDGLSYEIDGLVGGAGVHDYDLIFDPGTRSARLLVDGVERLRGYRGHREYIERHGLMFGVAIFRSPAAEGIFKRVRFQINPMH